MNYSKKKVFAVSFSVFLVLSLGYTLFFLPENAFQESNIRFPIRQAVRADYDVSNDSNIDEVASIGTNNTYWTAVNDQDSTFQNITEAITGGGGGSDSLYPTSFDSTKTEWTENSCSGSAYTCIDTQGDSETMSGTSAGGGGLEHQNFGFSGALGDPNTYVNMTIYHTTNELTQVIITDGVDTTTCDFGSGSGWETLTLCQGGTDLFDLFTTQSELNALSIVVICKSSGGAGACSIDALYIGYDWTGGGTNYRLNWEHQATSIPTGSDNFYNLTVYAQTSGENVSVYMWNQTATERHHEALFNITSTLQWYNYTVSVSEQIGSTMTWNYQDTNITGDSSSQDILSIDYAGVYVWSMTVTINQLPNATSLPNAGDTEFDSFPVNFTIDAGADFDLELKCTEGNGSVCEGNWLFWDVDADPSGYTQLTTSYQVAYVSQTYSVTNLNIWLWVVVPNGELPEPYSWTLDVRISIS